MCLKWHVGSFVQLCTDQKLVRLPQSHMYCKYSHKLMIKVLFLVTFYCFFVKNLWCYLVDVHNKYLMSYEFNKSYLIERWTLLTHYLTITDLEILCGDLMDKCTLFGILHLCVFFLPLSLVVGTSILEAFWDVGSVCVDPCLFDVSFLEI